MSQSIQPFQFNVFFFVRLPKLFININFDGNVLFEILSTCVSRVCLWTLNEVANETVVTQIQNRKKNSLLANAR